jgi:large subunit ribosomal protein L13
MHNIDATNQSLGRLASNIAILLRGKDKPSYRAHIMPTEKVVVENIRKMRLTGAKMEQKRYYNYSGYPGGMRETRVEDLFKKNPGEVLRKAVYGMLPSNKLRAEIIKNLEIKD